MPDETSTTRDGILIGLIAIAVSVAGLIYYFHHNSILLYGDAVAHINIARRVFDSKWPGPSQLGTVWLPLPHILMLPFIVSNWAWRTGLGGSIPSMLGYVAGAVGIFRLLRGGLASMGADEGRARIASWFGALAYVANPNLIYIQSTAMGEPFYLAFFIWATVFFREFVQGLRGNGGELAHVAGVFGRDPLSPAEESRHAARSLCLSGVMVLCCEMSRYDGWFAAGCFGATALLAVFGYSFRAFGKTEWKPAVRNGLVAFMLIVAVGPTFWMGWNKYYFNNALEWYNGPYSARGIMARTQGKNPPHPGFHNVKTAAVYYVKCAKLNLTGHNLGWGGARYGLPRKIEIAWPVLVLLGTGLLLAVARSMWPLLLLWIPLPFYALSIAYGGVPIFMPVWWPFSFYNVRYGLQMLPVAVVFLSIVLYFFLEFVRINAARLAVTAAAVAFVAVSYTWIWQSGPVCLHEPQANSSARIALELQVGDKINSLPRNSTLLMRIGYYVGVLQRGGIPLKRTINESNYKVWERALADPAHYAEYLVAADNDEVAEAARVHAGEFESIARFEAKGEPAVTIYKRK